jgi:Arc/MetJ-type ribon-helix-helix transcriptional regulator
MIPFRETISLITNGLSEMLHGTKGNCVYFHIPKLLKYATQNMVREITIRPTDKALIKYILNVLVTHGLITKTDITIKDRKEMFMICKESKLWIAIKNGNINDAINLITDAINTHEEVQVVLNNAVPVDPPGSNQSQSQNQEENQSMRDYPYKEDEPTFTVLTYINMDLLALINKLIQQGYAGSRSAFARVAITRFLNEIKSNGYKIINEDIEKLTTGFGIRSISTKVPKEVVNEIDKLVKQRFFPSRAAFIRVAIAYLTIKLLSTKNNAIVR